MKKAIIIAFFLLFLFPVKADRLSPSNCPNIMSGEQLESCQAIPPYVPVEEQKQLVLALIYDDYGYPNYAFMKSWNTEPDFFEAPEGISLKSSHNSFKGAGSFSVIQKAWLKIAAINPSLKAEGEMYSPRKGEVQTEFNYEIHVPVNIPGEHVCPYLYEYSLGSPSTHLKVSLNGNTLYQGSPEGHRLVEYSASSDMQFQSELQISVSVTEEAYEEEFVCVPCGDECENCYWVCDYAGINSYVAQTTLEDYTNRKLHDYSYFVSYVMDGNSLIVVDLFSTNPLNSYHIYFNGAEFEKKKFNYSVGFSLAPYDVLHAKAIPYELVEGHNMHVEEEMKVLSLKQAKELINYLGPNQQSRQFLALVEQADAEIYHSRFFLAFNPVRLENLDKCEMQIWSHFERIELKDLCAKKTLPETNIDLDVNSSFNKGEEINGSFQVLSEGTPFDGNIIIEFQNEKKEIPFSDGQGQFTLEAREGGILALSFPTDLKHGSQSINKKIFVQDESVLTGLFEVFLFFAGWIFVFIVLNKYLKRWFP